MFYRIWDRKTPRHKWQIVGDTANLERARQLANYSVDRLVSWAKGRPDWDRAQVCITQFDGEPQEFWFNREDWNFHKNDTILWQWQHGGGG